MPESGSRAFFVVNLLMLQLRVFFVGNVTFTRFFCRECRDYALFGVEFYTEIWQKFSEILRILAEILTKKMAAGASGLQVESEVIAEAVTFFSISVSISSCLLFWSLVWRNKT